MLFTELPLCDTLLEGLQAMNFRETTPVQEQAIPVILEKKDVIACAQTGTGKTAAFLLPLLNNLQTDKHEEGKINAIVMAPTRELAQQIDQQMEGFSYFTPFSSVAVYGGNDGEAWDVQKRGLMSGADVVIATPGRLLSHINLYNIDFSGVKYFILDEADRMLDMGFFDDIMKIEKLLPKDRQTIMFSATMPPKIQQLAKTILRNPVDISIAISRPPETILQSAYICHEAQKINIVKHLFKEKAPNKVILFSGSKQKVKEIAKILTHLGLSAGEMHSDLDQSQRNHVMHEFKNERVNILVATDIVARGIDIDDISLVINFDVPYDAEDYVHRIGRTARAGDSGMAITFVSPDEQYRFSKIEEFLGKKIYRIPVPAEFGETPEYNPIRDNRRNALGRKGKGKGKGTVQKEERSSDKPKESKNAVRPEGSKDSKQLNKTEKPSETENKEGIERTNRTEKPPRPKRPEKTGKLEKQGEPKSTEASRSGENTQEKDASRSTKRSHQNERTHPDDKSQQSGKVHSGENDKGQPSRKKDSLKKQPITKKAVTQRDSNSPATDKSEKRTHTKDLSNPNRKLSSQTTGQKSENTTEAKKSKKWSWWPFGKK